MELFSKGCGLPHVPIHLLINSTGLKVRGAGKRLQEGHGAKARRTCKMRHLAVVRNLAGAWEKLGRDSIHAITPCRDERRGLTPGTFRSHSKRLAPARGAVSLEAQNGLQRHCVRLQKASSFRKFTLIRTYLCRNPPLSLLDEIRPACSEVPQTTSGRE